MKIRYKRMMIMDDGQDACLTLGKEYEATLSDNEITIIDDQGVPHSFPNFGESKEGDIPTEVYFEVIEEPGKTYYHTAVCKGSWALGTACEKCQRCKDTDPGWRHVEEPVKLNHGQQFGRAMRPGLTISAMCKAQWGWVDRMGWHNSTALEKLALVASEFGEAVDELDGDHPLKANIADLLPALGRAANAARGSRLADNFGVELADIVLRVADIAEEENINLERLIIEKMALNETNGTRGRKK